jgi:hypothetical protein
MVGSVFRDTEVEGAFGGINGKTQYIKKAAPSQ